MSLTITPLSDIRKGRSDWVIKVRVARKWEIKPGNALNLPPSVEFLLIDAEGQRIQATVSKAFIQKFKDKLDEYKAYVLCNLCVGDNRYKIAAHPYKLFFMEETDILYIGNPNFAREHIFKLVPFNEVLAIEDVAKSELIDVVGKVVAKGTLREQYNKRTTSGRKFVEIELEDTSKNKLSCTLWGDYADEILTYIETVGDGPLIVLLQMVKPNTFLGLPNHQLSLKVGVLVMLLRNIDHSAGLCNGTRLIVTRLGQHVVKAKILNGNNIGEKVFVPRMSLTPSDLRLPFSFQRRQFPLVVSYAMTINKSQGQSLTNVGLFLKRLVFSHDQLYVALSRVTTRAGLKILVHDEEENTVDETTNVVYKEVFQNL